MGKHINYAKLSKEEMDKIKKLEQKIGACLLAYSIKDGPDAKSLSDEDLAELKRLENELCLSLVAYSKSNSDGDAA